MKPAVFATSVPYNAQRALSSKSSALGVCLILILFLIGLVVSIIISSRRKEQESDPWLMKSKLKAILLAVFFGPFGAHRFYLNHYRSGFIQLMGTVSVFVSLIVGSSISAVDYALIFYFMFTQLWNKLDIFFIIFGGLIPKEDDAPAGDDEFARKIQQIRDEQEKQDSEAE
ncbi:MAG: TM2 domain-containing protein [Clostridia bacterium]|nr:TM2 domain-containing protein [Clostridia bacterium]